MKKNFKIILSLAPFVSLATIPLIAASCDDKEKKLDTKINEVKGKTTELENIIKFEKENTKAKELLEKIKKLEKKNTNLEDVEKLLKEANDIILAFNQKNKQEKSGLVIHKFVSGQENIKASDVVKELKETKNWEDIKKVFDKYSIKYELKETQEISVDKNTHAHDDEGEIHLDLLFGKNKTKERFTLLGFKIENK
ncbi:variable surface lipoprotein [Metamycoplasma alkalescens]|uniref:Lipoprotein n=1 Tax=Metamycoplasma alkalescens TaxID=45363 RepID=A0A318U522_9BACT|nr:variable surface lipoprotein [Metamycoplasma alkalescens]PYF43151.1 hypothetical protein BCF88_10416 [Metamycoplasma alkalescens]SYV89998.1 Uncharacterised protein [Metamycoplasma alkalescens]